MFRNPFSHTNFFDIIKGQKEYLDKFIKDLEDEGKLVETLSRELRWKKRYSKRLSDDEVKNKIQDIIKNAKTLLELITEQENKVSSFDNIPEMMTEIKNKGIKEVFCDTDKIYNDTEQIQTQFGELLGLLKKAEKKLDNGNGRDGGGDSGDGIDKDKKEILKESGEKTDDENEKVVAKTNDLNSILIPGIKTINVGDQCWFKSSRDKMFYRMKLSSIDFSKNNVTCVPLSPQKGVRNYIFKIEEFIKMQQDADNEIQKYEKEYQDIINRAIEILKILSKSRIPTGFEMAFIMGEKSFMLSPEQIKKGYYKAVLDIKKNWKDFIFYCYSFLQSEEIIKDAVLNHIAVNKEFLSSIRNVDKNIKVRAAQDIVINYILYIQNISKIILQLSSKQYSSFEEQIKMKVDISNLIIEKYAETSIPQNDSIVIDYRTYKNQVVPLIKSAREGPFKKSYKYYIQAYDLLNNISLNNQDIFYTEELEKLKQEIKSKFEESVSEYLEFSVDEKVYPEERTECVRAAQHLFMLAASRRIGLFDKQVNDKKLRTKSWKEIIEEQTPQLLEILEEEEPTLLELWENETSSPELSPSSNPIPSSRVAPRNKEKKSDRETYSSLLKDARDKGYDGLELYINAYEILKKIVRESKNNSDKKELEELEELEKEIQTNFQIAITEYLKDSLNKKNKEQKTERKIAKKLFIKANKSGIRLFNKYPNSRKSKETDQAWKEIVDTYAK